MNTSKIKALSAEERDWAKNKVDDVFFGCVLNIKLYQSRICAKLITEMNAYEMVEYTKLIAHILQERDDV